MGNAPVYSFHSQQIRMAVFDNRPWFVAKDVCAALAIDWSGKTLVAIPESWQCMGKLPTLRRGAQRVRLISEPAVYKLAFRSNKPEADAFTNWVASEVLPSIRKTGKYEAKPKPKPLPPSPVEDAVYEACETAQKHLETAAAHIDAARDALRAGISSSSTHYTYERIIQTIDNSLWQTSIIVSRTRVDLSSVTLTKIKGNGMPFPLM